MANELTTVKFELAAGFEELDEELKAELEDELSDLVPDTGIDCKKIKVKNGGMFTIETDDEKKPEKATEIEGVMIFTHRSNGYWSQDYGTGENQAPDCMSMDGKQGVVLETGEIRECEHCPYNQYGTDKQGRGKACKNTRRIYLLLSGKQDPYLLSVPPTSMRDVNKQLSRIMGRTKTPYTRMVLKFSLENVTNKVGMEYSKIVVEQVGVLPEEVFTKTAKLRAELKGQYKNIAMTADGFVETPVQQTGPDGFVNVDDVAQGVAQGVEDELPFN